MQLAVRLKGGLGTLKTINAVQIAGKVFFWVGVTAIYFNIGWVIESYYMNHIVVYPPAQQPETFLQWFAAGWNGLMYPDSPLSDSILVLAKLSIVLFWPMMPGFFVIGGWLFALIYYFLWLIFAGGIAKLLGIAS